MIDVSLKKTLTNNGVVSNDIKTFNNNLVKLEFSPCGILFPPWSSPTARQVTTATTWLPLEEH